MIAKTPHQQRATSFILHLAMLIASIAPALSVGAQSLSRPYFQMGSDQDLLWASEALRLLRGVGPSYADHPGALWAIVYGLNIKILSVIFPEQITDTLGSILPFGINKLIAVAKIENALFCGLTGYLTFTISRQLGAKFALAALINGIVSFSYPVLNAAQSIRHEIPSMVLLMATAPLTHQLAKQAWGTWQRKALGILVVCLIFAAAFSKQQSLISLPYFALLTSVIIHDADQKSITKLKSYLHKMGAGNLSLLAFGCMIPWLICAAPDIDLINLPVWTAINASLAALLMLAGIHQGGLVKPWAAIATMAGVELIITKIASPNWWRQAVTGFPSWLLMFSRKGGVPSTAFMDGIQGYFQNLFSPAWAAMLAIGLVTTVAAARVTNRIIRRSKTTGLQQQADFWEQGTWTDTAWLVIAPILLASTARVNPPYGVYFLPPILIAASCILSSNSIHVFSTLTRASLLTLSSIAILSTASIQSLSNAQNLGQFTSSGLPKEIICVSQNMDQSMHHTAVGQCSDFSKEAAKKTIFNDWRGPR